MHRSQILALCAGTFLVAATVGAKRSSIATGSRAPAQVRFSNKLAGDSAWSLAANGNVIFTDVASGMTTAYLAVSDSVSTLTLQRSGVDSTVATTKYLFVHGSYYTVSATLGNGDRPILAVERDQPPNDSIPRPGLN